MRAKQARLPGSSTARASRAQKKRGSCIDPSGYDTGKKINGKKRHILVDTQGLLMHAIVHAADVQDRDGAALLMATLFGAFPFLTRLFPDGGYQGGNSRGQSTNRPGLLVEIVKRSHQAKTFVVLTKRWIVERTLLTGLAAAEDWPRTGSALATKRSPSSASLPSATCCENNAIPHGAPGETLRPPACRGLSPYAAS